MLSDEHPYRCYYCTKVASLATDLVGHQINHLHGTDGEKEFSIRKLELDENLGVTVYRSKHFRVSLRELKKTSRRKYKNTHR